MSNTAYTQALESPKLDSSDYILLVTQILTDTLGATARDEIAKIQTDYLNQDYDDAIKKINALCDAKLTDPALAALIKSKQDTLVDNPLENQSRRFFETKYSQAVWASQEKPEFASLAKLNELMKQKLLAISVAPVDPGDDKGLKAQADAKKALASLPDDVKSIADAQRTIAGMRGFGEVSQEIVKTEGELRKDPSPERKNIASTKDRGAPKPKDASDAHGTFSVNPGIVRSTSPVMPADREDTAKKNKVADSWYMNTEKPGYSASRPEVPFVNSISGTAFTLAAVLKAHIEANSDDPNLEHDVNNITKAFVGFTCKEGYHSLAEMVDALNSPSVQKLFEDKNIKLNTSFLTESALTAVVSDGAKYSKDVNLQRGVNTEVTAAAGKTKRADAVMVGSPVKIDIPLALQVQGIKGESITGPQVAEAIKKVTAEKGADAGMLALERFVAYAEAKQPKLDISAIKELKAEMTKVVGKESVAPTKPGKNI